jgi:ATPase family associated with various cellular activities (AAA)
MEPAERVLEAVRQRVDGLLGEAGARERVLPDERRVEALTAIFGLSPLGRDALLCLFTAELDPRMRLYARAVQTHAQAFEIGTVAELLALPAADLSPLASLLAADGPLVELGLVETELAPVAAMAARVRLEPRIARYLMGDDRISDGVVRLAAETTAPLDELPELGDLIDRLQRRLGQNEVPLVEIVGAPGTGRCSLAHAACVALGAPLVVADLASAREVRALLREARREARLIGGALCLRNWETAEARPATDEGTTRPSLPAELVRFLRGRRELVFITSESTHTAALRAIDVSLLHVGMAFPGAQKRARILATALDGHHVAAPALEELEDITRRHALDPRRLWAAAADAASLARDGQVDAPTVQRACREQLSHELNLLSDRVTQNHRLDDLVVAPEVGEVLGEMLSFVRESRTVYDDWGFARRHSLTESVSALFSGPPGTGKTMCASAIARELDMELFRVDLSRVISKWLGETEKNLGRVFDEAERSNAILLFDEADSLFAKRTGVKSAQDRYANLEVNYLLQRLESFRGISILTSNSEESIDPAFKRRLTFRLRFDKPDFEARAELWAKVFPAAARLAEDVDPIALARVAELSGASIRNAALRAAFAAASRGQSIDQELCVQAASREATEMGLVTQVAPRWIEPLDEQPPAPLACAEAPPRPRKKPIPICHPRAVQNAL